MQVCVSRVEAQRALAEPAHFLVVAKFLPDLGHEADGTGVVRVCRQVVLGDFARHFSHAPAQQFIDGGLDGLGLGLRAHAAIIVSG
jgi:hypothetical protein